MQVYTQRLTQAMLSFETADNCWDRPPQNGEYAYVDQAIEVFEAQWPGKLHQVKRELDYCIVCSPTFYIIGKHWGDESTLAAATAWSEARNTKFENRIRSNVMVCEDWEHPTQFTIDKLLGDLGNPPLIQITPTPLVPIESIVGYFKVVDISLPAEWTFLPH